MLLHFSILSPCSRPWSNCQTTLGRRTTLRARSSTLFLNSVAPTQTPTHLLKWCCNSLEIRKKETWLPRSGRFLKVTLLLVQLQGRPLIFGETIPTSRVQVPIPEAHLVAVDASDHSTSGPEPFLDAVLIAEELVILLVSLKLLKSDVSLQYIGVSVPLIVCLRYLFVLL